MHALMTEVETTLSRIIQHSKGVCMIKRIPCDKIHLLIVHSLPLQALSLRDPLFKVDIYSGHEKHLSCPTSPE